MTSLVKHRPAELGAFFVIAPAVYGWLVEVHVPNLIAALVGAVAGLIPAAISWWKDGTKAPDDPGDGTVTEPPAVKRGKHEKVGLEHHRS